jgi:hypothetical protein
MFWDLGTTSGKHVKFLESRYRRLLLCAIIGAVVAAAPAYAVIIDSGDGTGNTTAPADDPGWSNIGSRNGLGVVYLRNGWVITANHVGAGDILLDGGVYTFVPGTAVQLDDGAGTMADLVVFGITPLPAVADLPIRTNTSLPIVDVIMAGRGRDRGAATDSDGLGVWTTTTPPSNPVPARNGYYWGPTTDLRWGTNKIEGHWVFSPSDTISHYTYFDEAGPDNTTHESQATLGDSGGAVFAKEGVTWELSGIMWAIAPFSGQIAGTSALYGNATLIADLSRYAADINAITAIAVPEPSALLQLGVGTLLTRLMYWRRSRA